MFNELNAGNGPDKRREHQKNEAEARPLADREVPILRESMIAAVHGWLDGELPEAAVRSKGFDRQVELWKGISADLEVRRRVATPAGAMERIMAALPQTTPTVITPWHTRPVEVTPVVAAAAGAGLLAVGVALGAMLSR